MARQIIDGCTAATHVAYALSDVATIYPITPIAEMGQTAQQWGLVEGRKNLMGQILDVREMESELGAAGATHGALRAGALATTFTCSQGLALMFPNMFKIAGEQLPAVFHVGSRSLASHALSIFGDHQDVMACRATGFAVLASANVQETMDLALVAHLAAIDGSMPVVHLMDGWRTSNEMSTIEMIDYEDVRGLVDWEKVADFRRRAMNPETPDLHGSAQNPDVFFQNREACNSTYAAFPAIVGAAMKRVGDLTGRRYGLIDYHGAADAEYVMVAIGSSTMVAAEAVDWLNARGAKTGLLTVRLVLPFPAGEFVRLLPPTVKGIAVMNRTKEPGSSAEPLTLDVMAALYGRTGAPAVYNGRYGLSSKDFTPSMAAAVFEAMAAGKLGKDFTVGINDDVTHLSVDVTKSIDTSAPDEYQAVFYGIGSDGTVSSTKLAAGIIGGSAGLYAQAFFSYSAKKSGGYTISQLRFAKNPITSAYGIEHADYIGCNKDSYITRYHMLDTARKNAVFVLNTPLTGDALAAKLPPAVKRRIARLNLKFYTIDAAAIAAANSLGVRINTIMMTVFLYLSRVIPFDEAKAALAEQVKERYMHAGGADVANNLKAIDDTISGLREVSYPASWADEPDQFPVEKTGVDFIDRIARPCLDLQGDRLPVSLFAPDGRIPAGTTAYEKRAIALEVPQWNPDKCIQCTECSLVCSHAAIRPLLLDCAEAAKAPAGFATLAAKNGEALKPYRFRIQVWSRDCTGCASCATICPGHALTMMPAAAEIAAQTPLEQWVEKNVTYKENVIDRFTINGSQFMQPLMEFSGACGGCGETPYVKLLTQLFGDRMLIANATGCSSIWGGDYPSNAYCANAKGHGPAWANSLFEDNAEFGFGMAAAVEQRRKRLLDAAGRLTEAADATVVRAAKAYVGAFDDPDASGTTGRALVEAIEDAALTDSDARAVTGDAGMLRSKTVWAIGGDGWAYDIGFAGLDHVLASGQNINILVLDTECYSNTGGQTSKATPMASTAKYSPLGKTTFKKDLARMMMTYGNIYVATVSLGANYSQTITAMREAEAYPGPSIIVAYCPCINHGIRTGMSHSIVEERDAVRAGYWPLMRYNPSAAEPLTVDCAAPDGKLIDYINNENRYADLRMISPADADRLQPLLQKRLYSVFTNLAASVKLPPVLG